MRGKLPAALCALLCLALCLGTARAAEDQELGRQRGQAMRLESLGLFLGVGEYSDGTTDFALWRSPSRAEAVTMLVRALGKEDEAAEMGKPHPFTDVPAWADGYVSYAWENGLAKGVSDTAFGAWEDATGEMYVTFMLRALGYADGTDFTWDDPWTLAQTCGILPEGVDRDDFRRGDAVEVTAAALFAGRKGTDTTLADQLIAQGAFSREDFDRAFRTYEEAMAELAADDFYLEKERWESDCGTVLLGNAAGTPHPEGWSLRLVTKPASALGEGLIIQLPIVRTGTFSTAQPDQVSLSEDGLTFTYSFYFDHPDVEGQGTPDEYVFHEAGTYTYTADLSTGMAEEAFQPPEGPPLTPEEEQQAYDDAIHEMMENGYGKVVLKRCGGGDLHRPAHPEYGDLSRRAEHQPGPGRQARVPSGGRRVDAPAPAPCCAGGIRPARRPGLQRRREYPHLLLHRPDGRARHGRRHRHPGEGYLRLYRGPDRR